MGREQGYSQNVGILIVLVTWWRHQMETFSPLLAICAGNSPVSGEFPAQRPVTRSFDVFFDLRLNKRLSKQWWGWWFETLSGPLWCHCNDLLSHTWVRYPGFGAMGLSVQYWPRWFQDFRRSDWLCHSEQMGPIRGCVPCQKKIFFVCEISCFWVK